MQRVVSARIDGLLAERELETVFRALSAHGGRLIAVHSHAELRRTYLALALPEAVDVETVGREIGAVRVDSPALAVWEIVPAHTERLAALEHALGGPGRPLGVVEATRTAHSLIVAFDGTRTAPILVLDIVDVELEPAPGRRILPLLPWDDDLLTAFARDRLGDPALDRSRLIESYIEEAP